MDMRKLVQFYEVCRQGSFKAAGEQLYLTQQAIGKSMHALEGDLGVRLFIRERYGVRLTQEGEYLKQKGKVILDQYDIIQQEIRKIEPLPQQTLSDQEEKTLPDQEAAKGQV